MRDAGREVSLYRGTLPETSSAALAAQLLGLATRPQRGGHPGCWRRSAGPAAFRATERERNARCQGISAPAAGKRYVRALNRLKGILDVLPGGMGEF